MRLGLISFFAGGITALSLMIFYDPSSVSSALPQVFIKLNIALFRMFVMHAAFRYIKRSQLVQIIQIEHLKQLLIVTSFAALNGVPEMPIEVISLSASLFILAGIYYILVTMLGNADVFNKLKAYSMVAFQLLIGSLSGISVNSLVSMSIGLMPVTYLDILQSSIPICLLIALVLASYPKAPAVS